MLIVIHQMCSESQLVWAHIDPDYYKQWRSFVNKRIGLDSATQRQFRNNSNITGAHDCVLTNQGGPKLQYSIKSSCKNAFFNETALLQSSSLMYSTRAACESIMFQGIRQQNRKVTDVLRQIMLLFLKCVFGSVFLSVHATFVN